MSTGEEIIIGLIVGPPALVLVAALAAWVLGGLGAVVDRLGRRRIDRVYDEREGSGES